MARISFHFSVGLVLRGFPDRQEIAFSPRVLSGVESRGVAFLSSSDKGSGKPERGSPEFPKHGSQTRGQVRASWTILQLKSEAIQTLSHLEGDPVTILNLFTLVMSQTLMI